MAEPIYSRSDLSNLVQLSSLINSSLETQEALNNALMSVEQALNAEVSSIFEVDQVKGELFIRLARGPGSDKIKTLRLKIGRGHRRMGGPGGKAVDLSRPLRGCPVLPAF